MLTLENLTKCLLGQLLSITVALSMYAQSEMHKKHQKVDFLVLYSGVFVIIFLYSVILQIFDLYKRKRTKKILNTSITIKKDKKKTKFHILNIILCFFSSFIDFVAGVFLNNSFSDTNTHILFFIIQLTYPMSVIAEIIIFRTGNLQFKKVIAFVMLSIVGFIVNMNIQEVKTNPTLVEVSYALISNTLYLAGSFLISFLLTRIKIRTYLQYYSIFGFISGVMIQYVMKDLITFRDAISFITKNIYLISIFWMSIGLFYISATPYIEKFGVTAYNGSLITSSVYYGIYKIFNPISKNSFLFLILFIFCILADLYIICLEEKENLSLNRTYTEKMEFEVHSVQIN